MRGPLHGSVLALALALTLALALALTACGPGPERGGAGETGFDFAVMGDTPYTPEDKRLFPLLAEDISHADVAFVIHVGDIKGGTAPCTDSVLTSRIADLNRIEHPVVYVPGDNEWTDCHNEPPDAYAPLERLAFLRSIAYPTVGRSLGTPPMEVESQATGGTGEFPEHQRWMRQGVLFATLHAVGSRNGLAGFPTRTSDDDAAVHRRISGSLVWLRDTFAEARDRGVVAVVIATQADPWIAPADATRRTGFEEIMAALREHADRFGRPVLFIHGDSHVFRVDRPFWSEEVPAVPNFMRLENYGSPDVGWTLVHVDPTSPQVFGFTPRQVIGP